MLLASSGLTTISAPFRQSFVRLHRVNIALGARNNRYFTNNTSNINNQSNHPAGVRQQQHLLHHHHQHQQHLAKTIKAVTTTTTSSSSLREWPVLQATSYSASALSSPFFVVPARPYCTTRVAHTHVTNINMAPIPPPSTLPESIDELIALGHVVVFTMDGCRFCSKVKQFLDSQQVEYVEISVEYGNELHQKLQAKIDKTSVPQVFIGGKHIGGCDDVLNMDKAGKLSELLKPVNYDYDLIVIGGGSGGLAASKEAASLGKKVALLDFVTPTPHGVTWGLGGTCVNVGCIPKKLMHHASLIGGEIEDSHFFGWVTKDGKPLKENLKHDWSTLVTYVQNNIKGSNFTYKGLLRSTGVNYINAFGRLVEKNKIKLTHKNGKEEYLTSRHFIVSTGERPKYPKEVEGAVEYAITSDDLFSLPYNPGKTLVIGASYVALECAGFLKGIGNDVTVMVRSIFLRGFDRQCSELVGKYMEEAEKVRFIRTSVPKKIERLEDGERVRPDKLKVTWVNLETNQESSEVFDTVLFAVGRVPCTETIGLDEVGVTRDKSGYIPVTTDEQTNIPNIYAIGDILAGKPQLTPVAIEAGVLLARRLYAGANVLCDYLNVPTTVFTPLEYGSCGYTEELALAEFGADGIEVYHQYFSPTEWRLNYYDRPRTPLNSCYAKVIVTRSAKGDPKEERLLGFHYVGPMAGEVIQFVGIPLKLKATKADLDALIGIHPTCAEIFTTLTVTKRSGKEPVQQGCCG